MKGFSHILILCVFFAPAISSAQVIISEIMYDLAEGSDSGREWIEIYNAGSVPVTVSDLKITENETNHAIKAEANAALALGGYAVIADNSAKFKADWPAFSGLLFDSAFSLNNTGESIGLADATGVPRDAVVYTNASGNGTGDSLQRQPISGASFGAGIPTPGVGIPVNGLVKSPTKQKTASKKNLPAAAAAPTIVGEAKDESPFVRISAPTNTQGSPVYWWLAPLLLACASSAGIVWSRHLKKDEWEIEEMPETQH